MTLDISDLDMELAEISLVPDLRKCAILLDIDGTILDLAPSPQQVWVPPDLRRTLARQQDETRAAEPIRVDFLARKFELTAGRAQLLRVLLSSFEDVVRYAETHQVNNRIAAYMLAIDRVAYTIRQRGIYA